MNELDQLIQRVAKTQHGFGDILKAASEVVEASAPQESQALAKQLFASEVHQARMLATFIFGMHAAKSKSALRFLRKQVSSDPDWRVQEILAQAFDRYCKDVGYERALPVIVDWLADPNPNVRRAVTEGLRIWTSRPYFREHPDVAIRLLSPLKADESDYVRRSVGNALRDISRKHGDLVKRALSSWDTSDKRVAQVHKLAGQFLKNEGDNHERDQNSERYSASQRRVAGRR